MAVIIPSASADPFASGMTDGDALPIDEGVLLGRCMGNRAFAMVLLSELESSGGNQVASIRATIMRGQLADAADAAHSLKGSAAILGAEPLRVAAEAVESATKRADHDGLDRRLDELDCAMTTCLAFIPGLRDREGALPDRP